MASFAPTFSYLPGVNPFDKQSSPRPPSNVTRVKLLGVARRVFSCTCTTWVPRRRSSRRRSGARRSSAS
eukprot:4128715-Pleurochrysis_carterae.AAC.1